MPEHPHNGDAIINPETHREKSDVSVRALIWFAVICVVSGALIHFTLLFFFRGLVRVERNRNAGSMTAMSRPADMSVPKNQPLLQPFPRRTESGEVVRPYDATPVIDLAEMRRAEQRALTSYGWVDQQKGVVHMPIDVAMRVTLERGLPVQAVAPPAPAAPAAEIRGATPAPGARP